MKFNFFAQRDRDDDAERIRRTQAPNRIADWVKQVRDAAKPLRGADVDVLRFQVSQTIGRRNPESFSIDVAACFVESIRQSLGLDLFDTQIAAGIVISHGAVAEMQTGEGKTLAVGLAAILKAIDGRGVHVATPNGYLAHRDRDRLADAFERLGFSSAVIDDDEADATRRYAYRADITYAAGHTFGFDYLRDQVAMAMPGQPPLGSLTLSRLTTPDDMTTSFQRGLIHAIVDEIDHVLIDDAVSPLILSTSSGGRADDADLHLAALRMAETLKPGRDFLIRPDRTIRWTDDGLTQVYRVNEFSTDPMLRRPWNDYVLLALRAKHCHARDVDYIVRDDRIAIADASTGRIHADRSWSDGLQQAVEAAEGLPIRPQARAIARITRQRFYRLYSFLGGTTGTAIGCEDEFAGTYGLPVITIPLRTPSRRCTLTTRLTIDEAEKINAIVDETVDVSRNGRPVLVGTLTIDHSNAIAIAMRQRGLRVELLNGVQDADEAAVIAMAGHVDRDSNGAGAITVATALAGRGTDIVIDPDVAARGGLHVIVCQTHLLARVDRQLIGRSARCGDPGSSRTYVAATDPLVSQFAPWIGRAIRRRLGSLARVDDDAFDAAIARAQQSQQHRLASMRASMLRSDRDLHRLMTSASDPIQRCYQL